MRLSTRGRYGTRLMLDLAENYERGPIPLKEIAARQKLSVKYLEQLIIPLRASGLIRSVRGARGGYQLARDPAEISVGEVVEALEGEVALVPCVTDPSSCDMRENCPTHLIWCNLSDIMKEQLISLSLQDALNGSRLQQHSD